MEEFEWPPVLIMEELDYPLIGEWDERGVAVFVAPRAFVWSYDSMMWLDATVRGRTFAVSAIVWRHAVQSVNQGDLLHITLDNDYHSYRSYRKTTS
jgi:hypothetical protein